MIDKNYGLHVVYLNAKLEYSFFNQIKQDIVYIILMILCVSPILF